MTSISFGTAFLRSVCIALLLGGLTISLPAVAAEKLDLNNASVPQLTTLPGIGPKLAKRIVDYRLQHKFRTVNELKQVKGIGDRLFATISERLAVDEAPQR